MIHPLRTHPTVRSGREKERVTSRDSTRYGQERRSLNTPGSSPRVVAFVVLLLVLPGRARIARRFLQRGVCPQCRGELRQYEHEELKYYCPPCQVGFTTEGRRAPRGADPS